MSFAVVGNLRVPASVAVLCASWSAQAELDRERDVRASRTVGPIRIDGKIDGEWGDEAPFTRFIQLFPDEGRPPTESTALRVRYDDAAIYIAIAASDHEPDKIVRNLGRRDSKTASDAVTVYIDSKRDTRTAYVFQITAAGVMSDSLVFHDTQVAEDWDAVWDGAVTTTADGWSAELKIPLSTLRFSAADEQAWGFTVKRTIARKYEELASFFLPRASTGIASGLGRLTGLVNVHPRRSLMLEPYLAARALVTPQFSDPSRPRPRMTGAIADVGFDARWAISTNLELTATVNPDFGQVEADEIILNLTAVELELPEKRPFFTSGLELFEPVEGEDTPHRLFYTRRIGLDAPIVAAAKLGGTIGSSIELGLVEAIVAGGWAERDEADPDTRYQFHLDQPLHLGPNAFLPAEEPPPRTFFAGVMRGEVVDGFTLGGVVTSAVPLAGACTAEQAMSPAPPTACRARGGNTAALDFAVRSAGAEWMTRGQATVSQAVGGPPSDVLLDGTAVAEGEVGAGIALTAGKLGGEPFRFRVRYNASSPQLDLNASGFQQVSNNQFGGVSASFVRPAGLGALKELEVTLGVDAEGTLDDRLLRLYTLYALDVHALLPGFISVDCAASRFAGGFNPYEIPYSGIAFEQGSENAASCTVGTAPNARVVASAGLVAARLEQPFRDARFKWSASGGLTLRPTTWTNTILSGRVAHNPQGIRFVGTEDDRLIFGDLDPRSLSVTLRQELVLDRDVSLQLYGQLFVASGRYDSLYEAPASLAQVTRADLMPTTVATDPSFHVANLNVNLVLRWEYRRGSTLFVVYSRSQEELPMVSSSLAAPTLDDGRTVDTLAVKLTYLWAL